jgi:hypothetical protein
LELSVSSIKVISPSASSKELVLGRFLAGVRADWEAVDIPCMVQSLPLLVTERQVNALKVQFAFVVT